MAGANPAPKTNRKSTGWPKEARILDRSREKRSTSRYHIVKAPFNSRPTEPMNTDSSHVRSATEVSAPEHPPSHSHPILPTRFFLANGPTGEFDEDILQRRPSEIHALDLDRVPAVGEGADHVRDELVTLVCLDDHLTFRAESGLDALKLS